MEYIKEYISKDQSFEAHEKMKTMIAQNKWINYIQYVLADSKVYYSIQKEDVDLKLTDVEKMINKLEIPNNTEVNNVTYIVLRKHTQ
jgi:hypothetical protein